MEINRTKLEELIRWAVRVAFDEWMKQPIERSPIAKELWDTYITEVERWEAMKDEREKDANPD